MKSKIISTLIENPEWYQSLVSQGVPLDPDQGEQIQQCAEKIADVLSRGPVGDLSLKYKMACVILSHVSFQEEEE